jgi:hypothetical protein
MLTLAVVWLAGGALVGALALVASVAPGVWWRSRRASRWGLVGLGALAALIGGLLGVLLFGRFLASAAATWIAVLAVVTVPRGIVWLRHLPASHSDSSAHTKTGAGASG